ncbi:MAG: DUF262 domain-containing protein [Candidatus Rokubacteria bacterium]|nr:DUF262 domain-containing protein [Candidatus Rokubacteria bacterium]
MPDEPEELLTTAEEDLSELFTPFQYAITSYGADYPVDGLVKRISAGSIFIPPFQRGYVWTLTQASKFVESLLLGLPVPGIFLSKEEQTQRLMVIDGQQRLRTLEYFYEGIFRPTSREFALQGVQPRFEGATYKHLADEDKRRLDDSILHATIVKQEQPSEDDSSIYYIFERLNTGGLLLHPQEIRAAIYHGPFNDLLKELNQDRAWRSIYGPVSSRMRDQELILRFFALYFRAEHYSRPMKAFLNSYMGANRALRLQDADHLRGVFLPTIDLIAAAIGDRAFKPKRVLNAAVFDAVTVGIARRIERRGQLGADVVANRYNELLTNHLFVGATERSTTDEESVRRRLDVATMFFDQV